MYVKSFGEWLLSEQFCDVFATVFFRLTMFLMALMFMSLLLCGTIWTIRFLITQLITTW